MAERYTEKDYLDYQPMAQINVTPLVDVMLVLLVIFMVAAPLMVAGVPIELPSTTVGTVSQPRRPLIVSLSLDGSVYLRGDKVAGDDIAPRLRGLLASEGDAVVYIRADRGVPYGRVVELLGRVGESGYTHVSLLANPAAAK